MARNRNKKKETEVEISDIVEVSDVPVIDNVIIEDEAAAVSNDGFIETETEAKEEKVVTTKETEVESIKPEDGLIVEKKEPKVIKKVHNHGGIVAI